MPRLFPRALGSVSLAVRQAVRGHCPSAQTASPDATMVASFDTNPLVGVFPDAVSTETMSGLTSGRFAALERVPQTPKNARPLTRDIVEHSHGQIHDLPETKPRLVDRPRRLAFVGACV